MARRRGAILVLVLFVMVVLGLAALSFTYQVGLERRLARGGAIRAQLEAHAASAVAIAIARLRENANDFDHRAERWHTHRPLGGEGWLAEWEPGADGGSAEYAADYEVLDEEAKLHVARASSRALAVLGLTRRQAASLLDWMDDDDIARPEGAEREYYESLAVPYRGKNGPLELLDELRLVRGIGREYYLGERRCAAADPARPADPDVPMAAEDAGPPRLGWVDLLTCHGEGRINLNTAPRMVLATLPLSDGAADQILAFRRHDAGVGSDLEQHVFRGPGQIDRLQGLTESDRVVLRVAAAFRSTFFRIFAWSVHRRTGQRHEVEVLIEMRDNDPRVLRWKAGW